jgi:hypothetical protein
LAAGQKYLSTSRKEGAVASITRESKGRRLIQFIARDGKRKSIRLGKVSQRLAEEVKVKVEALNSAGISGHAVDEEVARWPVKLDHIMVEKLAAVGLVPRREAAILGSFINRYIEGRHGAKPRPSNSCVRSRRNLTISLDPLSRCATSPLGMRRNGGCGLALVDAETCENVRGGQIRPAGLEPATYGSEGNPKPPPKSPETPVKSEVYAPPRPVARAGEHDPRIAKIFGISAPCAEDSAQSRSPPTSGRNPASLPTNRRLLWPKSEDCFEINSKSLYLLTRPTLQPKFPNAWEGFSSSSRCFIKGSLSLLAID